MASLKVLEEQPSRLVLGKGGASGLGSLIGIIVFGVVALIGLTTLFEEGGAFNPVMIVFVLVIGFFLLSFLARSITSTRVILDADQKLAARTDSLFFIPVRQKAITFNLIRDVSVSAPGIPDALTLDVSPIWQVALRGADGSNLVVNDRGMRSEMNALAEQVGVLVGRPAKLGSQSEQATASAAATTAGGIFGSLVENLTLFAESLGSTGGTVAPPVSVFPPDPSSERPKPPVGPLPDSPYAQASARMTAQQAAAGASGAATNARAAAERETAFSSDVRVQSQMSASQLAAGSSIAAASEQMASDQITAFSSDVQVQSLMGTSQLAAGSPIVAASARMASDRATVFSSDVQVQSQMSASQLAAGSPFTQASARLAEQQAQAQAAMGFSMPSMLTMPQMPPMLTLGTAMDMPSFAPISTGIDVTAFLAPETREVKIVEQAPGERPDPSRLFDQARRLLASRNYRDAEKAYLAALSTNPADPTAHNDLGVVYFAENNLHEAENAFRRTIALDPFNAEGRYNLGLTLNRQGKRAEAKEVFRVGAQTAGRGRSKHFQEALRGTLHDPLTS